MTAWPADLSATALLAVAAYLCGSIPTGVILTRPRGIDLRSSGSGNIGATNAYRVAGKAVGSLTLAGDVAKGLLPVLAARALKLEQSSLCLVGFAAFVGHLYPVFLRFRGGKGVATALGIFLGLTPVNIVPALTVFAVTLWRWRFVALASCAAALSVPVTLWLLGSSPAAVTLGIAVALLIVWRHRENFRRLSRGEEPKVGAPPA